MLLSSERFILITLWMLGITGCLMIPERKRREAWIAFLACQAITWIGSLVQVRLGWIAFPVREFPKATDLCLTTEFFFYPLACAIYYIFEPKHSATFRICYSLLWVFGLTLFDWNLSVHTEVLDYKRYTWYWSGLDFAITFVAANIYTRWFFKSQALRSERRNLP
ncbi:hypothetical protein FE783_03765 [Paenibacillus mesophilus]|uniref:CBO0543 family protein n=1 Tax=Paenibacillus mesophilus TaxID=2582849 RepID=UPI00110D8196|nr:CBO0543 family protein [Paenibacillus mesophilus]TMV52073.1 hypothetical protein FE783_03765 [Paenibacillus mesophilus]